MTSIIFSAVALAVAITALVLAVLAYATVIGMQRSTHQVQWMPMPEPDETPKKSKGEMAAAAKSLKDQIKEYAYPNMDEEYT